MILIKSLRSSTMTLAMNEYKKALQEENIPAIISLFNKHFKNSIYEHTDNEWNTAFHIVAKKGTPTQFEELMANNTKAQIDVNRKNSKGQAPLHCGIKDLGMVNCILKYNSFIALADNEGNLPLHLAAQAGLASVVDRLCDEGKKRNAQYDQSYLPAFLLESKFDVRVKNKANQSAYRIARIGNHPPIMQKLASLGGEDNYELGKKAIEEDNVEKLVKLIDEYPYIVRDLDEEGRTLIHHAILNYSKNTQNIITRLVAKGAAINAQDNNGRTPAHLIAATGLLEDITQSNPSSLLDFVVGLGANVKLVDNNNLTPLHHAAMHNKIWAIDKLVQMGCYVDRASKNGLTPLHIAALYNGLEAFKRLIHHGALLNSDAYPSSLEMMPKIAKPSDQAITSLWIALHSSNQVMIETIIDIKIARNNTSELSSVKTGDGNTLLHFFASVNSLVYFRKCVEKGCNPYKPNAAGLTPLHVASAKGHTTIVRYIVDNAFLHPRFLHRTIEHTFNMEAKTTDGKTAWFLAKENDHQEVMTFLVSKGATQMAAPIVPPKGIVTRTYEFAQSQHQYSIELEKTFGYKLANAAAIMAPAIMALPVVGPVGAAFALGGQAMLLGTPYLLSAGSHVYYWTKPILHNHTHWLVEGTAHYLSYGPSWSLRAYSKYDLAQNLGRRTVGFGAGLLLANSGAYISQNKDLQGALYVLGRQLGNLAVDAYKEHAAKAADAEGFQLRSEDGLIQGLQIWESLVGKEKAEAFVYGMHRITELRDSLYEVVGEFEHQLGGVTGQGLSYLKDKLTAFDSYKALSARLDSAVELLSAQSYMTPAQEVVAMFKYIQNELASHREKLAQDLEILVYDKFFADTDYGRYAKAPLLKVQLSLEFNKSQEAYQKQLKAESLLNEAEKLLNEAIAANVGAEKVTELQQQYDRAKVTFEASKAFADECNTKVKDCSQRLQEVWAQTPRGMNEAAFKSAQQNEADARWARDEAQLEVDHLNKNEPGSDKAAALNEKLAQRTEEHKAAASILAQSEEVLVKDLFPVEKERFAKGQSEQKAFNEKRLEQFKDTKLHLLDKISDFEKLEQNVTTTTVALFNAAQELKAAKYQYNEIQKLVLSIEKPGAFDVDSVVATALAIHAPDDKVSIRIYILSEMVKTGVITLGEAERRMANTFDGARSDSLLEKVRHHWDQVFVDYKGNVLLQANTLKAKLDEANKNYQTVQQTQVQAKEQLNVAKNELKPMLAIESQTALEANISANQQALDNNIWEASHSNEGVKSTIGLVGQPKLALEIALDLNKQYSPLLKNTFANQTLAKWLVNYKYTFLKEPSLDLVAAEIEALAVKLGGDQLSVEKLTLAKANIDADIATLIVSSSLDKVNLGAVETSDMMKSLMSDVQLTQALQASDQAAATSTLVTVLQQKGDVIAKEEFGDWSPTPVEEPIGDTQKKKERHGPSRLWHNPGRTLKDFARHPINTANDIINPVMQKLHVTSAGIGVNSNGKVQVNFGGQPIDVASFAKPKPVNLFEIVKQPLTNDPVYNPKPVGTALSSKPLPSVLPTPTWIPTAPTPGLVNPDQFRVVPAQPKPSAGPAVLPMSTYLPSLGGQNLTQVPKLPATQVPFAPSPQVVAPVVQPTTGSSNKNIPAIGALPANVTQAVPEKSLGEKVLGFFIKDAGANPLMAEMAMVHPTTLAGVGIQGANGTDTWFQDEATQTTPFPIHVEALSRLLGRDPEAEELNDDGYRFPKFNPTSAITETLVDQPGQKIASTLFPISNPLLFTGAYFRKSDGDLTTKGRIKAAQLPTTGRIRFVPPKGYHPSNPLDKGPNHGYYDKFDNEWTKGPSRTPGEAFEWDVQLSPLGKKQLGWIAKEKDHINVSLKGKITHG